jgi:WD40 repeat protein
LFYLIIGHTNTVQILVINDEYLFSGSIDTTVIQWDVVTSNIKNTFYIQKGWIQDLFILQDVLYVSSGGYGITKIKFPSAEISSVSGSDGETKFTLHAGLLYFGCSSGNLSLWNSTNLERLNTFKFGFFSNVWSVVASGNILYTGHVSTIYQWKLASAEVVAELTGFVLDFHVQATAGGYML